MLSANTLFIQWNPLMKDHPPIKTTILEIFSSYVSVIVNELTKDHPSFKSFERT